MKRITGSGIVVLVVLTLLAMLLVAGCGGNKTTSTGTTPSSSSVSTTPSSAQASSNSSSLGSSPATSSNTLPKYEPSTVVSDAPGSLQLTSTDSIQKVTAFYDDALAKGGWSIISNSKTAYSTNITAKKGSTGTTLSISTTGSGTYISLVTYPM